MSIAGISASSWSTLVTDHVAAFYDSISTKPSSSSSPPVTASRSSRSKNNKDVDATLIGALLELGIMIAGALFSTWLVKKVLNLNNGPHNADEARVAAAAESRLARLWARRQQKSGSAALPVLSSYESLIAQDVINPDDITTSFQDIGGLDDSKQEIWELAVLPLQRPDLFASSHLLRQTTGGILLYGPPGTGKTMLAKAIAKEADATFIAVKLSKIMNKWFGESNKLIDATFSLAKKLAPSIIFIDELDTFLNPRDGTEGSAGNAIKAEFLTLWDGMETNANQRILVLGATNRPNHVDAAILRRLPRSFRIPLPNARGRLQILALTLAQHPLTVEARRFLPELAAQHTVGYSGSDLKELCKCAALESVREVVKAQARKAVHKQQSAQESSSSSNEEKEEEKESLRPLSVQDFQTALTKVKRTGQDAAEYERNEFEQTHPARRRKQQQQASVNMQALNQLLASLLSSTGSEDFEDAVEEVDEDEDEIPNV